MSQSTWQSIAARKQVERRSRIPKAWLLRELPGKDRLNVMGIPRECGILSPKELDITESYDATALAQAIALGRLKSADVVTAFCKRAAIAHQVTNCLTEIFFDDAIDRARHLDQELARTHQPIGPLHGVPISLKDTFKVKGYDATIGIAALAFNPARTNSPLVEILLHAGAVLYCKTNIPQTLMSLDSENNLFGRTMNPWNSKTTAGGSSGGEGVLVAMRGSVLGVGTDVGGSIRIPAMCNGVYGFKPSAQRIPYSGQENGDPPMASAKIGIQSSAGPIAASLRDCELFMKAVADAKPWETDPAIVYGSWWQQGEVDGKRKPLFGVIRTDGLIAPLPPIVRLLNEVVNKMQRAGYEVVEVDLASLFKQCQSLANAFFGIDGGKRMLGLLEQTGEPLTTWLQPRMRHKEPKSLPEVVELHARRMKLETEFLKVWTDAKSGRTIDSLICPVAPHPVPPIDRWNGVSYTSSFVLLDYPAGTIPVRFFKTSDLEGEVTAQPLSSWDKVNQELWDEKTIDRRVYLGTPLAIQMVAPKLQERRLYKSMKIVERVIRGGEKMPKL